jgi:heme-degrading monooxygenase HmoA
MAPVHPRRGFFRRFTMKTTILAGPKTEFILWYWDARGAWREWDTYDSQHEAKVKGINVIDAQGGKWVLEQREIKIIDKSKDAIKASEGRI